MKSKIRVESEQIITGTVRSGLLRFMNRAQDLQRRAEIMNASDSVNKSVNLVHIYALRVKESVWSRRRARRYIGRSTNEDRSPIA